MRIPDSEQQALLDWSMAEYDRIAKEYPYNGELDGPGTVAEKEHVREFNKRLEALKARYGRKPEPVAKARTFNQLRQAAVNE